MKAQPTRRNYVHKKRQMSLPRKMVIRLVEKLEAITPLDVCISLIAVLSIVLFISLNVKIDVGEKVYYVSSGDTAYKIADHARYDIKIEGGYQTVDLDVFDVEDLANLRWIHPGDSFRFHVRQSWLDKLRNHATIGVEFTCRP